MRASTALSVRGILSVQQVTCVNHWAAASAASSWSTSVILASCGIKETSLRKVVDDVGDDRAARDRRSRSVRFTRGSCDGGQLGAVVVELFGHGGLVGCRWLEGDVACHLAGGSSWDFVILGRCPAG
jgi:hypothetical protein